MIHWFQICIVRNNIILKPLALRIKASVITEYLSLSLGIS